MKTTRLILHVSLAVVSPQAAACVQLTDLSDRGDAPPAAAIAVQCDPAAAEDVIAPVVYFRLARSDGPLIPEDVVLAKGELTERELTSLATGQASITLRRRLLPAEMWTGLAGEIVVAPHAELTLGSVVSIGVPPLGWSKAFAVVDEDPAPRLHRVWPVGKSPASLGLIVWCLRSPTPGSVPVQARELSLGPRSVRGTLNLGALDGFGGACVHWAAAVSEVPQTIVAPPAATLDDGTLARIEPERIDATNAAGAEDERLECTDGRVAIGPGCAEVLDDRMLLHANGAAALVAVEVLGGRSAGVLDGTATMLIRPLPPSSRVEGWTRFVDAWGRQYDGDFAVNTLAVQPHVVINEVMANPAGQEPDQEWVEVYNDGLGTVELQGWKLEDTGLTAELPQQELEPGKFALVVNDSYREDDGADAPPAKDTPVLRVPHLGKSGLSNTGEEIVLLDTTGRAMSRVPPRASTRQSVTLSRVVPDAPDLQYESYCASEGGGTPGATNRCGP